MEAVSKAIIKDVTYDLQLQAALGDVCTVQLAQVWRACLYVDTDVMCLPVCFVRGGTLGLCSYPCLFSAKCGIINCILAGRTGVAYQRRRMRRPFSAHATSCLCACLSCSTRYDFLNGHEPCCMLNKRPPSS